ncbi:MAG TPA: PAC2 family protein [Candidatus Limnocylindrales bacterium]|jgi:proteasome assembly chaperone (PAC2) family protein
MGLYRLGEVRKMASPTLVVAFDSWVDAGGASTTAAGRLADDGEVIATFDSDLLFDYRSRRPTLDIIDGRPKELTWPEVTLRQTKIGKRDVLVLWGLEPDFRWRELADDSVKLAKQFNVVEWISLGAIPAAVPHTRAVPILGTESQPGLLLGDVQPGPQGLLRVPSAAISVLDMAIAVAGIPTVGYFAQVPHYVSGAYPAAAIELLRAVSKHLGQELDLEELTEEASQLRTRLDAAIAVDEKTRLYLERLESMADEARLPSGDDLIADIERFLRGGGTEGGSRERLN